jgi:hypothetical protein
MQASQAPQVPTLTPLSLAHLCAKYLQIKFRFELNARPSQSSTAPPARPVLLPIRLALELDTMVVTLVGAFLNPGEQKWTRVSTR